MMTLPRYTLTHLPNYPSTHSLTHSPTYLPNHPLTHLPNYLSTHSLTYLPTHPLTHPLTHSTKYLSYYATCQWRVSPISGLLFSLPYSLHYSYLPCHKTTYLSKHYHISYSGNFLTIKVLKAQPYRLTGWVNNNGAWWQPVISDYEWTGLTVPKSI